MKVGVYNEAGELVGMITEGQIFESDINEFFFLGAENALTDDQNTLALVFPEEGDREAVTLVWDGTGLDGKALANGAYVIKVESVDSLGITTVITGSATILRSGRTVTVKVFNEAGELVWVETKNGILAGQAGVLIQGSAVDPGLDPAAPGGSVKIVLGSSGVILWSGQDMAGQDLANGSYLVEVEISFGQTNTVISETVTVLSGPPQGAVFSANPNPVSAGGSVEFRMPAGTLTFRIKVYTVSGELIRSLSGFGDQASWDLKTPSGGEASAGLYLILAESRDSKGSAGRSVGRLVVLK